MSSSQGKPSVFISYNYDQKEFAYEIAKKIDYAAHIVIDKDLPAWSNLTQFMKGIRKQDFAVLLISDEYLKSINCMYEISQLVKDEGWQDKVMSIVFENANVYDIYGQEEYTNYWTLKLEELENRHSQTPYIEKVTQIRASVAPFLETIRNLKNPPVKDALNAILHRITQYFFDDCTDMQMLLSSSISELSNITKSNHNQIILSAKTSSYSVALVVVADKILKGRQKYRIVEQSGLIANCYATGEKCNCGDVRKNSDYFKNVMETASELVIPISFNNQVIGVFNSESESYNYYTNEKVKEIECILAAFSKRLKELGYKLNCSEEQLPHISI